MKITNFEKLSKYDKEIVAALVPEMAYKFVNEKMPDEAWKALDKCLLMEGVTPENLSELLKKEYDYPEQVRMFFAKALEHRKWLIDTGIFE